MKGYIHSIESFGAVDGPGVRYTVFFQGCPMRCIYCHNPDTWEIGKGNEMSVEDVLSGLFRNREFYRHGGLTATGGEPMLQLDFLTQLFTRAKEKGISTCLDTSGICFDPEQREKMLTLIRVTDLVLLDLKHIERKVHRELTGCGNERILAFAEFLQEQRVPFWVRHVVVPGITDQEASLLSLGHFLRPLTCMERLEVLPYHSMGEVKYQALGLEYKLHGVPQLSREEAKSAEAVIRRSMSGECLEP